MSELCAKLDQYIETKRKELEALGQNTGEFEVCAYTAAYGDLLRMYVPCLKTSKTVMIEVVIYSL